MKKINVAAVFLLAVFFALALASSLGDSNTTDEVAHTPAGYSYVVKRDMRLNPEHPPLVKDLAGLSVWLWSKISNTTIYFNDQHPAWKDQVNGQWDWGFNWLFRQGNDADRIIFWARLPMMLLGVLFGWFIFRFGKEFFGGRVALVALFFYAFSPTVLAHTRLVTTDLAAAFGFFVATGYFLRWWRLKREEGLLNRNLLKAGTAFGLAQLLKFSAFLLAPFFIILAVLLTAAEAGFLLASLKVKMRSWLNQVAMALGGLTLIGAVGMALIWFVYLFHVANYPPERQRRDTEHILASFAGGPAHASENVCNPLAVGFKRFGRCPAELTVWASDKPLLRPLAQYSLGLLMTSQRALGGNTTYFLGEVSRESWWYYFPLVYALKETLAFHALTLLALVSAVRAVLFQRPHLIEEIVSAPSTRRRRFFGWLANHPAETSMMVIVALYWLQSIKSNLNIGLRHVLPTFPFIFLLVSRQITNWLRIRSHAIFSASLLKILGNIFSFSLRTLAKYGVVAVLLAGGAIGTLAAFPHYLPYFNGLVGTDDGWRIVVDSNYDWGQDLKRLKIFVEERQIEKIKLYYFGGSMPEYYLGKRFEFLSPNQGPQKGWLAVSATLLQGGRARPRRGFDESTEHFRWLDAYQPVARAGKSIFVYYIP